MTQSYNEGYEDGIRVSKEVYVSQKEDEISSLRAQLEEMRLAVIEECAKIAEADDSFMMLQDFGLQSAVTQKGINIATAIRSLAAGDGE